LKSDLKEINDIIFEIDEILIDEDIAQTGFISENALRIIEREEQVRKNGKH
jgi:hypothetical protein